MLPLLTWAGHASSASLFPTGVVVKLLLITYHKNQHNIYVFSRLIADSHSMVHAVFSCHNIGLSFSEELWSFTANSKGTLELQEHISESHSDPFCLFSIPPSFQIVTAAVICTHQKVCLSIEPMLLLHLIWI